jgi:hypothetical protein
MQKESGEYIPAAMTDQPGWQGICCCKGSSNERIFSVSRCSTRTNLAMDGAPKNDGYRDYRGAWCSAETIVITKIVQRKID